MYVHIPLFSPMRRIVSIDNNRPAILSIGNNRIVSIDNNFFAKRATPDCYVFGPLFRDPVKAERLRFGCEFVLNIEEYLALLTKTLDCA